VDFVSVALKTAAEIDGPTKTLVRGTELGPGKEFKGFGGDGEDFHARPRWRNHSTAAARATAAGAGW